MCWSHGLVPCHIFQWQLHFTIKDVLPRGYKFSRLLSSTALARPPTTEHYNLHSSLLRISSWRTIPRTNHGERQKTCSIGKEVAEDGSTWEEESDNSSQRRWSVLHDQGPLHHVHSRCETVQGTIGVPQHDGLRRAAEDVQGGVWLRKQWQDHTALW